MQAKKGKGSKTFLPITQTIMRVPKGAWLSRNSMDAYDACCNVVGHMLPVLLQVFFIPESWHLRQSLIMICQRIFAIGTSHSITERGYQFCGLIWRRRRQTPSFRVGVDTFIGKTGNDLCPIMAVVHYLSMHNGRDSFLFIYRSGKFLTTKNLVVRICNALGSSGIVASNYSGHSFKQWSHRHSLAGGNWWCSYPNAWMMKKWGVQDRYIKTQAWPSK